METFAEKKSPQQLATTILNPHGLFFHKADEKLAIFSVPLFP